MGDLNGKIILDATNPLAMGPDGLTLAIGHSTSAGEKVQGWAKGASVFKTLNITGFGNMADPIFHGVRGVMFVAGDDAANKPKVVELVGALGFEVVDAGPFGMPAYSKPMRCCGLIWPSTEVSVATLPLPCSGAKWQRRFAQISTPRSQLSRIGHYSNRSAKPRTSQP